MLKRTHPLNPCTFNQFFMLFVSIFSPCLVWTEHCIVAFFVFGNITTDSYHISWLELSLSLTPNIYCPTKPQADVVSIKIYQMPLIFGALTQIKAYICNGTAMATITREKSTKKNQITIFATKSCWLMFESKRHLLQHNIYLSSIWAL